MRSLLIVPLLACALATLHPARAQQPALISAAARPVETTNGRRATIDAAPQSWLSKNKWYIVGAALFAYVLAARALGDQK